MSVDVLDLFRHGSSSCGMAMMLDTFHTGVWHIAKWPAIGYAHRSSDGRLHSPPNGSLYRHFSILVT